MERGQDAKDLDAGAGVDRFGRMPKRGWGNACPDPHGPDRDTDRFAGGDRHAGPHADMDLHAGPNPDGDGDADAAPAGGAL